MICGGGCPQARDGRAGLPPRTAEAMLLVWKSTHPDPRQSQRRPDGQRDARSGALLFDEGSSLRPSGICPRSLLQPRDLGSGPRPAPRVRCDRGNLVRALDRSGEARCPSSAASISRSPPSRPPDGRISVRLRSRGRGRVRAINVPTSRPPRSGSRCSSTTSSNSLTTPRDGAGPGPAPIAFGRSEPEYAAPGATSRRGQTCTHRAGRRFQ